MENLQRVIEEARPMLEQFLIDIGLHHAGLPLDFPSLLDPFSRWLDAQDVTEDDRFFIASRLAAFICEYLIDVHAGQRVIEGGRILMRVPLHEGVLREFDPYAVAVNMATSRNSLGRLLVALCS
ncbi:MAG: hypothetical protein K8R36_09935 [Planctomycetales bacterium]|nr:hypothetical protein [Planctomycetales bacterium]